MTQAIPKTSTLVLAAKSALSADQRRQIVELIAPQLPAEVGLVVLDTSLALVGTVAPEK